MMMPYSVLFYRPGPFAAQDASQTRRPGNVKALQLANPCAHDRLSKKI